MSEGPTYTIILTATEVKMLYANQLMAHAVSMRPESDPFYWRYVALLGKLEAAHDAVEAQRRHAMSDKFERRQPTAAEVAHGLGLEVDMLRQRIAELEAELAALRAERWQPDTFDKVWAWIHESTDEEARND